ncbi:MAG TPA: dipeptide/oligopeptide/nickel ABC transporter ATP-binding protein, partial [Acidimicrobiales bacterium]|nr:dipeptide/oligopeptide/nickel ABC transporter ATP-binding protein [Acidimicrobiales bacterium]
MTEALLQIRNASKTFRTGRRTVTALDDVSLAVGAGELVALVGESGSGKSTLGRVVVGLERLDAGEAIFAGAEYSRMRERPLRRLRREMHLVLQDPYQSLHPGMRVGEAVAEPLAIEGTGGARCPRVAEALEEVGLTPASQFLDRYPHQLSGGQRQRVVLARALVGRPRLVVADEPTSMVDATLRGSIVTLMRDLSARHGIAFLVITHDVQMVLRIADELVVLQDGAVVERGTEETLVADYS